MTPAEAVARARATWHEEGEIEIDDDEEEDLEEWEEEPAVCTYCGLIACIHA